MKNLRRLISAVALTLSIGLVIPVLPQSVCNAGSCGCFDPGQTSTPPCASAQVTTDFDEAGETQSPPALDVIDLSSVVESAVLALLLY